MKRVIRDLRPLFFVAENVRGLLNIAGGRVVTAMVEEFRELGYRVDYRLLNARDFGVPQHRERVFIVGNRIGVANPFPTPTHGPGDSQLALFHGGMQPYRTLRDAIGDLGPLGSALNHEADLKWQERHPDWAAIISHIAPGQKLCNVRLGERSVYTWDIPEVFGAVTTAEREVLIAVASHRRQKRYGPRDGNPLTEADIAGICEVRRLRSVLASLVAKDYLVATPHGYELKNAFNGIFRRLRWDEPSEAVLTVFDSPRYYVHPGEGRQFQRPRVCSCPRVPRRLCLHGPPSRAIHPDR